MELIRELHLRWPWAPVLVAAGVLLLAVWWARRRRPRVDEALLVAHTARLRGLPRYRTLLRRHRLSGALMALASLVVVAGTALVLARPQVVETEARDSLGRDIMLCLDASRSMDKENVAVVREMRRLVDGLSGDRVGLILWSGTAAMVFPLTDDYDFVRAELERAEHAFAGGPESYFAGVDVTPAGSSLIGDGIVSCVNRFDRRASERTRAVLVSSDNDPVGAPLYSLAEAARHATTRNAIVYGIGAPALAKPERATAHAEFADALAATGGMLTLVGEDGTADRILERINDLEEARAAEPPRRVARDAPELGVVVGGAGVGLLALVWGGGVVRRTRRGGPR